MPKFLKIPPLGGQGGPTKKIFFQKVITYQDATFLGQKFFSKTNILGSQFFSDPLGPKIRKIAKTGPYGRGGKKFLSHRNRLREGLAPAPAGCLRLRKQKPLFSMYNSQ